MEQKRRLNGSPLRDGQSKQVSSLLLLSQHGHGLQPCYSLPQLHISTELVVPFGMQQVHQFKLYYLPFWQLN